MVENRATHVLEHQVNIVLHTDHFLELHYIHVVQPTQSFDFPKTHGFIPTFEFPLHLLNGDCFSRRSIDCLNNRSIRAIAAVFYYLEFVHFK